MRRSDPVSVLTLALGLVLALLLPVPGAITAEEVAPTPAAVEELLLPDEPNLTPLEPPTAPDALDPRELNPGDSLRENKIAQCDEGQHCPAGCACLIIRNQINCFC